MENVIIIFGEENFLIKKEIKKISKHFLGDDIENVSKFNLENSTIKEILEDVATPSLFSNKKVVFVDNSYIFTGTKSGDEKDTKLLEKYISNPLADTALVFIVRHHQLDSRKRIVKIAKEKATIIEAPIMKEEEIIKAIKKIFEKNEYKISNKALRSIVDIGGTNFSNIYNEVTKLMIYKINEKEITDQDVIDSVIERKEDNIFALVDAVINKNIAKSLEIYNKLMILKEEPVKIISMLAVQFRLIYQTKLLSSDGMNEKEMASMLKVHPYRVKLAREKAIKYDMNLLIKNTKKLAELDYNIKSGQLNKNIGLEMFFLSM